MFAGIFFTVFALFILSLFFKNDVIAFIDKDPNEYLDSTSKLATQLICDNVELPEAYKRYGGSPMGWNSLDKLENIINGEVLPPEAPDGTPAGPIANIIHIKC